MMNSNDFVPQPYISFTVPYFIALACSTLLLISSLRNQGRRCYVLNGILFEIDESFLQIIDFKQIIVQNCKAYMYLG